MDGAGGWEEMLLLFLADTAGTIEWTLKVIRWFSLFEILYILMTVAERRPENLCGYEELVGEEKYSLYSH